MSNKRIGNQFEMELCELLSEKGFWAHMLSQNSAGQPADIITAKDDRPFLIDCKLCTGEYFAKSRIEENQRLSMQLWENCGNGTGWFAVKLLGKIWMVELWKLEMSERVNLNNNWFVDHAICFDQWVKEVEMR